MARQINVVGRSIIRQGKRQKGRQENPSKKRNGQKKNDRDRGDAVKHQGAKQITLQRGEIQGFKEAGGGALL